MSKTTIKTQKASAITICTHKNITEALLQILRKMGLNKVLVENARCARLHIQKRFLKLTGYKTELYDSPSEIFRFVVKSEQADQVISFLCKKLNLNNPGRGSIYSQNIDVAGEVDLRDLSVEDTETTTLLHHLSLITAILSLSGSGSQLAAIALRFGAGVPTVSLGTGAGSRDKLGLLRITIPAEKEVLQLVVPAQDANIIQSLLIDEGYVDRPGGGFIYHSPIQTGVVDQLISIGRQEHAASIEQIIAAIDDLKKSTHWRKRVQHFDNKTVPGIKSGRNRELAITCPERHTNDVIQAAMSAGAGGATVSRIRCLKPDGKNGSDDTLIERCIICIPEAYEKSILDAVSQESDQWTFQAQDISTQFSHQPR